MNAADCLRILKEIKDVAFATVDANGDPQIRIIDVMLVEDDKLYFCTARGKAFYEQILRHDQVAVTGMNSAYQMVRLSGRAHRLSERKQWIDRIFEENPSMNAVYPGESRYVLEAFCISEGEVEFFDLGKEPVWREKFTLGHTKQKEDGYEITEQCIQCGLCESVCPQKCIQEYRIVQEHCLHCGLCYEKCPVQAIAKRN